MFGTYQRLHVHVGASNCEVIRAARRKLKKRARTDRAVRAERHAFYRQMLAYHAEARALVREWRM
jgi:Arc/MetJ-type ribon-helix-helix transcriptional regulator